MESFIASNIGVNEKNHLTFAGLDTVALASEYGTPLYLMDEDRIRENCRMYQNACRKYFPSGASPLYASKAASFGAIYRIMREEGMGIDVVSCGEILTAEKAGFDLGKSYFHSNNKSNADIAYAIDRGVGYFVADNAEELESIECEAASRGMRQRVLLRLTPGIDPHTYEAVNTGCVDSKFGCAIETGQAEELTSFALGLRHIELCGFHCHVGSQVFDENVFERAAVVMLGFIADIYKKYGYLAKKLDLGGGYGVRYVDTDAYIDIPDKLSAVAMAVNTTCASLSIPVPEILFEPGRSIVADAGMTLYEAGAVKKIPGYKNYVSVDGGMTDNPRFALYRSRYTCLPAGKMDEQRSMQTSIVGRCCESGDIIAENIMMPKSVGRGDIIAVCTTGAYNYSMASNYNRIPRPPVVMISGGKSYVAIKRETYDDLTRLDII